MRTISPRAAIRALLVALTLTIAPGFALIEPVAAHGVVANIRVSHDRYPAHVEPFLAVNPRHHKNLLGVAQLIVPDRSDTVGTFVSFDGGRTWHDNGPLPLPGGRGSATDVTVAFDAHGIGYVCATAIGGAGRDTRGIYVWRTANGGRSFHAPVAVVQGSDLDHPWIAGDQSKGGAVYVVWGSANGLGFARSDNAGRTFSGPRVINSGGDSEVPSLAAGPRGSVYAVYEAGNGGASYHVEVVSSQDRGRHFGRPRPIATVPAEIVVNASQSLPTSPAVSVDERTGQAYVAFAARLRGSTSSDILVARTGDRGKTWQAGVRATHERASAGGYFFQPQLAVDSAGDVVVSFFELRYDRVALYLERASPTDRLAFGPAQPITSKPFNPERGLPHSKHGLWWIGDYQGLATAGRTAHLLWNDARTGRLEIFSASVVSAPAQDTRATHSASRFVNVRVSHDTYRAHAEPSVAVNPLQPRNLLGSAMFLGARAVRVGTFVSFDGGRTWRDNGPLPSPGGMTWTGDTTVAFDRHGTGFVSAAVTSFGSAGGRVPASWGVYVWRSADGGRGFGRPVAVARRAAVDHPALAIAPDTADVFVAWRSKSPGGLAFSRSTDGGRHFSGPSFVFKSAETLASVPIIAAGPHGEVAIADELDYGHPWSLIQVFVSSDGGRTFSGSTVARASLNVTPAPNILMPSPVCVAIDPRDGSIYVAYSAYQPGARYPAIVVDRSRDHGRRWERQETVVGDSASGSAFQPRVVIDGSGGVDVSYLVLARGRVNLFLGRSPSYGARFTSLRVTTSPFNPNLGIREGGKTGAWWIGDYQGLAAASRTLHPIWNDTRTGRLQIFSASVPVAALR